MNALRARIAALLGIDAAAAWRVWLWHLFVLPQQQARAYPLWLRTTARWLFQPAANALGVTPIGSARAWLLGLLIVRPPLLGGAPAPALMLRSPLVEVMHYASRGISLLFRLLMLPLRWLERGLDRLNFAKASEASQRLADRVDAMPRLAGVVFALGSGVLLLICATTPLSTAQQFLLFLMMWLSSLVLRRLEGTAATMLLVAFSLIASSRYIWWRLTQTLELQTSLDFVLGMGLIAAECYTWLILLLGYLQNAWPLGRKPVPLPADTALWPSVDVYVPTYNEPLHVVKTTVLAALAIDWPRDKLKVYILDDGRRDEFRRFAQDCGAQYLIRPDNLHAKAGNLNHAMKITRGDFITIFDCDHIPTRSFLQTTVGWFLRDPKCAMLQTPHHFFSPDPFERNLGTFRRVPNEGSLFYGLIQDGNDLWNSTFFCGSCAVLRRAPLEQIGGIAVETVTEDAHTALKMHRLGYNTAYLKLTQAAGLATESLSGHIGQRIRWARGMAQIFRVDNPLFGRGLNLFQRICYSNAMLHFFNGLPRIVFLTAPLSFLFFEAHIINAAASALAVHALPHLFQANIANSRMQGRYRHSFWAEAYESVLAWYITLPTTVALINPKAGSFNVTAKGGLVERGYFDWNVSMPYIALAGANALGLLLGIGRLFWWNTHEIATVLLNMAWTVYNLMMLGAALGVAAETRQVRVSHRVDLKVPATLYLPDGRAIACATEDYSQQGMGLRLPEAIDLPRGTAVRLLLRHADQEFSFPARIVSTRGDSAGLLFEALTLEQERDLIHCTFGRADAWLDWSSETQQDRPLTSLWEVLRFGATGYQRLLQSFGHGVARLFVRSRDPQTSVNA